MIMNRLIMLGNGLLLNGNKFMIIAFMNLNGMFSGISLWRIFIFYVIVLTANVILPKS